MTFHPKVQQIISVFKYYLQFHGVSGKKPNRQQRRAAAIGVKIGKNTPHTKAKKKAGCLRRVRVSLT